MEELVRTRCTAGWLVLTDSAIRIERKGLLGGAGGQLQVLPRAGIVGVSMKNTVPSVFGQGGGGTLVFTGNGMTIEAKMVNTKDARRILELLGFA